MIAERSHPVLAASVVAALLASAGCGGQPLDAPADAVAPPAAQAVAVPARPAVDREAFEKLVQQVAALRDDVAQLRGSSARAPEAASAPSRHDPAARAQARRDERAREAAVEAAFRGEPIDAAWSAQAAARTREALAGVDTADVPPVRGVECRSATCRVEFGPGDDMAMRRALRPLLGALATVLPRATAGRVEQADGRAATVLYLSR